MDLILWRHAEAEESYPDLARQLTEKGRKQARKMADFLHAHLPADVRILSSPAIRTQQTAAALSKDFETLDALAPDVSVQSVLQAAHWGSGHGAVLVVGHQPTLGAVAAHLLGSHQDTLRIKKGSLWWFSRRGGDATLLLVLTPDFL